MDWGKDMKVALLTGAALLALALCACDAGPSATSKAPPNPPASISAAGQATQTVPAGQAAAVDPRDAPAPLATDGKPIWAANRKHTAQENADYQFGKNGKDFGAANEADYVAKVHAFVDQPPTGVQKVARSNGDALLYDAKTNTFAVVTKAGAPRTMFKPRDGASYWQQQVSREQSRSNSDDKSDRQSG
jgi:pyocin large subunit-like protein